MSSNNMNIAEAESRGVKRGADIVFDAQEAAGAVASKVANTASSVAETVSEKAVEVASSVAATASAALESAKENAAAAIATVQTATAHAVESVKQQTAAALASAQKGADESAEIIKKNTYIAIETVKENYNAANEKINQTVGTMKTDAAKAYNEAKVHVAEAKDIVQKNINTATDTVMGAAHKTQEGAAYAKGVGEGVVGATTGSVTPADAAIVSLPVETESAPVNDLPPAMAETGINVAKLEELSDRIPNKTMDSKPLSANM